MKREVKIVAVIAAAYCMLLSAGPAVRGEQQVAPTFLLKGDTLVHPDLLPSCFDTVSMEAFRAAHAFSLDHYFEEAAGYVLGRQGPIGADARLSRFGMGLGRCNVYMNGVPLNDPQNGTVPFALIPTTSVGSLVMGMREGICTSSPIEGAVEISSPKDPKLKPRVALDLSKGNNNLKQRRVRFSSIQSRLGLDLAYDELLNGGYQFDARRLVEGQGYGQYSSRVYSMRLRGELSNDRHYEFWFKRFTSAFQGNLVDPDTEQRRRGSLAAISARFRKFEFSAYGREHNFSMTDSMSENQTVGALCNYYFSAGAAANGSLKAGFDDIVSRQLVNGSTATPHLQMFHAKSNVDFAWGDFQSGLNLSVCRQLGYATGWGAGFKVSRRISDRHTVKVALRRNYRMPSLGELFLPIHASTSIDTTDTTQIAGNSDLHSESSAEALASLRSDLGGFRNDIDVCVLRIDDPILPISAVGADGRVITFRNEKSEDATVLLDRFVYTDRILGLNMSFGSSVMYSVGDKGGFLSSVPRIRLNAVFAVGREIFESSTRVLFTIEYQHSDSRRFLSDYQAPAYDVMHLKLDMTLLDAHIYLMLLNVLDEQYQTISPFLMTPRTFVYGVQWTLFD